MGFEGRKKPPEFVMKAAMAEDGFRLREMASAGGKAAAKARAEQKKLATEQEAKKHQAEQDRITEEREAFDREAQRIIYRDAVRHAKEFPAPDED